MMRGMVLAAAAAAAVTGWAAGTARTVRAHPWLTRGLESESLIGLTFENAYGGNLKEVTFRFELTGCGASDIAAFKLWRQKGPAYAFYETSAVRLDNRSGAALTVGEPETTAEGTTAFTVTYRDTASAVSGDASWIYPKVGERVHSDRIWLTASIADGIPADAEIRASVVSDTVSLGGNVYTVTNGPAPAPHRIYPHRYRIGTYLRNDRMKDAFAEGNPARDVFSTDTEARIRGLTDVTLIDIFPVLEEDGSIGLSWDRKTAWAGTVSDTRGIERLRALRDVYNPACRLHVSLTKGAKVSLDGDGSRVLLAHAASEKRRAAFVQAVVGMMTEHRLDGLDIDWEYPENDTENDRYGLLLRDLAEAFFEHGWELAMCTNQSGWRIPGGEVLAAADFVNSMAYGPWDELLGNSVMTDGIGVCTSANVPPRRIVVGQSIYSNAAQQYGWDAVVGFLGESGLSFREQLDADTLDRAWSYNGESGDYLPFCGPTTYRAKCNRVRLEGYGGVMSWGYYSDVPASTGLSLAMHQGQAIYPEPWRMPTPPQDDEGFYLLDSEADWQWFCDNPQSNVRLAADIAFSRDPLPITLSWTGTTVDGDGHTLTLPESVWIDTFGPTALFAKLAGCTVKNLTVDFAGRAFSRSDRITDGRNDGTNRADPAAVLAAEVAGSATIENVHVIIRPGAEVRGIGATGGLIGRLAVSAANPITVRNCSVTVGGTLRAAAVSTRNVPYVLGDGMVGCLVGLLAVPDAAWLTFENNRVILADGSVLTADVGSKGSVGGLVGGLSADNAANLLDSSVTVRGMPRLLSAVSGADVQPVVARGDAAAAQPPLGGETLLDCSAGGQFLREWREKLWGGELMRILGAVGYRLRLH